MGREFKVQHVKTNKVYLMTYIKKELFLKTISIDYFLLEKEILYEVKHPFLISMDYVVTDADNIYYFLEYIDTGSLFNHWIKSR